MRNAVRWILVPPAAVLAGLAGWAAMVLVWNVMRFVSIVPQEGPISLALANFGIHFIAACVKGANVIPNREGREKTVILSLGKYACGVGFPLNGADGSPPEQLAAEYSATSACEKSQLIHTLTPNPFAAQHGGQQDRPQAAGLLPQR